MRINFILAFIFIWSPLVVLCQDIEVLDRAVLEKLPKKVNSRFHEIAPLISPDGKTLYFSVDKSNIHADQRAQEIWFTTRNDQGEWADAQKMPAPLNTHRLNQVLSILDDGNTLFLRGGNGNKDDGFSLTFRRGNGWSKPQELDVDDYKKMNKGIFSGACMSSDKDVILLYFSEEKEAKFSDIYVSKRIDGTKYSAPQKLGTPINTKRDEFGPFLSANDNTLYFASNRAFGVGSADIYKAKRLDDSWLNWSEPENLGEPINTKGFDAYFTVDQTGTRIFTTRAYMSPDGGSLDILEIRPKQPEILLTGLILDNNTRERIPVISSVRISGPADFEDIHQTEANRSQFENKLAIESRYRVEIEAEGYEGHRSELNFEAIAKDTSIYREFWLTPLPQKALLNGVVYNEKTLEIIPDIAIELSLPEGTDKRVRSARENGYYESAIEQPGWVIIRATREGFLNLTDSVEIAQVEGSPVTKKDLYMVPVEVGAKVRLDKIYFDFDRATLRPESFPELNRVVSFLNENPTIVIEIGGHTDSKGSDAYNLRLSDDRANSVRSYLLEQGIFPERISAKGYGENMPEATNDTDEGRQINRRVEFIVLEK